MFNKRQKLTVTMCGMKINIFNIHCLNTYKYFNQYSVSVPQWEFSMFSLYPGKPSKNIVQYIEIHAVSMF